MNFLGGGVETALLEYMAEPKNSGKTGRGKGGRPKKLSATITFQPDDDIAAVLAQIKEALGDSRGIQTNLINSALRAELPRLIAQKHDALKKLIGTQGESEGMKPDK